MRVRAAVVLGFVLAMVAGAGTAVAAEEAATVTLVTGDRVTVVPQASGEPEVTFAPARGSERTGFRVHRDGGSVHVVPNDVAALVPGVLDPALFDVTGLIEMGYDDARADALPLIARRDAAARRIAAPLEARRPLSSLRATAVELDKDDASRFGESLRGATSARGGIERLWLDRKVRASALDGYLTQVMAPAAWSAGLDGTGVTVAVLDTGVDDDHPALAGQVDAQENFTADPTTEDGSGHGTHVASLVGGSGAGSDGARQGIATGARLLSGKVLDSRGEGTHSSVIAGMEWAARGGADIVNLSLGGPPTPADDPVALALEDLTEETGALFVVAAGNRGNFGQFPFEIESPGSAASALTVGAATPTDGLAIFSSNGPTLGTYRLKPDVIAPGVGILGARVGGADYVGMSGTSQATPIVAGAAALLLQQHPDWTWRQLKSRIVATADLPPLHTAWTSGGGRLDLDQATHETLDADLAALDFGYLRHPDDAPRTRTVTVANSGTEPVTLAVTDALTSDANAPAPDDALTASPAAVTVPAGGSASTRIDLDPARLADGMWQGGVTFSADGVNRVRLPVSLFDEPERHDFQLRILDRNGEPYDPATGANDPNIGGVTFPLFNGDTGDVYILRPDENGRASARIAPGEYSIFARIITPAAEGRRETFSIAGTPALQVRADTEYVIDAREAERLRPPRIEGQSTEARNSVGMTYTRRGDGNGWIEFAFFDPADVTGGRIHITPTGTVRSGQFETTFRWRLAPTAEDSPDAYELLFNDPRFPDPLSPTLRPRDVADLARVDATFRPVGPPGEHRAALLYRSDVTNIGFVSRAPQPAPATTRTLLTAAPDVRWAHCLGAPANADRELCDELHTYRRGERVDVDFDFAATLRPEPYAARHDRTTMFFQPGLGDGAHRTVVDPTAVDSSTTTLHRNGELVGTREGLQAFFTLPEAPGDFRLEHEWTMRDVFPRARRARTVWTFSSAPATIPPLMAVDYEALVDRLGRVDHFRTLRLELRARHLTGATAPARVDDMRLWWSTDGTSWERATARATGRGTFTASVPERALEPGDSLSLRAVATDSAGNRVDQTVDGIFPVR